jgi:DNA-binding NarL/FixJ family response regulator
MAKIILIADDSEVVRRVLRGLLETAFDFVICREAADGLAAIEKTRKEQPDLILLDLAMPKLNGAEAAAVLRQMAPSIPIVLFTMYDEAAALLAPAVDVKLVLSKSDGLSDLAGRVRHLLNPNGECSAAGAAQ